ncbi:MAG: zinc-dependent alcohol dehydrogenase family protein [Chloroflexi bacterium]|nr:zinc-dependent alcohol dehydrogenase family protein [Chloroflexota bacterium]
MRAVIIERPGSFRVDEVSEPQAGPGELLLQVGACGICGTDLHILAGEFPLARYPSIPGHEFAGSVLTVGEGVLGFREGDRVGVNPSVFCGICRFCRYGRANLCERGGGFGTSKPGAFAERVSVLAVNAYHLPDSLSFSEAAVIEPVSCAVHGMHRLAPRIGESVLIYGAGTMGLILAQLARFYGARLVALVDTNPARLERARTFGFDVLGAGYDDLRELAPLGFENVIEATGVTRVAEIAFQAVMRGGTLLLFGVCPPGEQARFEPFRIYNQEINVIGSMAVFNSYGPALEIIAAGGVDARRMVTHTFGLDAFAEALDTMRGGQGLKVQVLPG